MGAPKKRRSRWLHRVLITCDGYRLVATDFGTKFSRLPSIVLERSDGLDAMRVRRWKTAEAGREIEMLRDIGRELLKRSKRRG